MPILHSKTILNRPRRIYRIYRILPRQINLFHTKNQNSMPRTCKFGSQHCNGALNRPLRILRSENGKLIFSDMESLHFHYFSVPNWPILCKSVEILRSRKPGGTVYWTKPEIYTGTGMYFHAIIYITACNHMPIQGYRHYAKL